VAARARASAHARRASSAVAQATKIALTAASTASVIVIASSTWFSRSARSLSDPSRMSAWAPSAATIPLTVIAMLAVASTTRRGRRAATRSPSSSGTGSLLESAIARPCAAAAGPRVDDELRRLDRYRLLVIDEIGYLPLERQAANLLFARSSHAATTRLDHRHVQPRIRGLGRDPRRRHGRRRAD